MIINHRKILFAALSVAVLLSVMTATLVSSDSDADEGTTYVLPLNSNYRDEQGIKYTLDTTKMTATISGYYPSSSSAVELIFPSAVTYDSNEYKVVGAPDTESSWVLGPTYFKSKNITSLTVYSDHSDYCLPSDLFKGNTKLQSLNIILNESNTSAAISFGSSVFDGCTKLSSITLPKTVKEMGISVFANCTALTSLQFDTSIKSLKSVNTGFSTLKGYIFSGCTNLEYLEIGKNVTLLSDTMFSARSDTSTSGCTKLKVIYNAGDAITQDDVNASVDASGSSEVVIFNLSGGDLSQKISGYSVSGRTVSMTAPAAAKDGASIPQWFDSNGDKITAGESFSYTFSTSEKYHVYYAYVTLTYMKDDTVLGSQDFSLAGWGVVKSVSYFGLDESIYRWNTASDGSGDYYYGGDSLRPSANMVLYAVESTQPVPTSGNITYHSNDGSDRTMSQIIYFNRTAYLMDNPFASASTFLGWSTTEHGSVEYKDGVQVMFSADTDLYAVWSIDLLLIVDNHLVTYTGGSFTVPVSYIALNLREGDKISSVTCFFLNSAGEKLTEVSEVGVYTIGIVFSVVDSTGAGVSYNVTVDSGIFTIIDGGHSSIVV